MKKILTREEWRRRKQRKSMVLVAIIISLMIAILLFSIFLITDILNRNYTPEEGRDFLINKITHRNVTKETIDETLSNGIKIQEEFLTPNPYSRPQTPLKKINSIVIHYTANPGTTADNNRSYFEGLATKKTTYASSHYVVGLEGEVVQCIPLTEISFASNDRNNDTVSIECCHMDETGEFNDETYDSLVSLTAALCVEFKLEKEDIIRHYDVTGKLCPLYFVEHEDAWEIFKEDVMAEVEAILNAAEADEAESGIEG
jgi:N-acetyl-anhydromuramyl-L-alanine amidase AmpD